MMSSAADQLSSAPPPPRPPRPPPSGLNAMGCLLFSGIRVTASKSTPPSVCLGSFPPFQGVGKNLISNLK